MLTGNITIFFVSISVCVFVDKVRNYSREYLFVNKTEELFTNAGEVILWELGFSGLEMGNEVRWKDNTFIFGAERKAVVHIFQVRVDSVAVEIRRGGKAPERRVV